MATIAKNKGGRPRKMPAAKPEDYTRYMPNEEELIEQAIAGSPKLGDTISDPGDEETGAKWPLLIDIDTLETNGYVVVYHRKTREPSVIHRNSLRTVLRDHKDEDGNPAFTLDQPDEPPYRGTLKCFLHKDDPNRDKYDFFGFAVCRKHNLPTEYQRTLHMTHRHKAEWAAIQAQKSDERLEEEREYRKAILARLKADEPVPLAALIGGM